MDLSKNQQIKAADFNELKDNIKGELNRRNKHNFTFNNNLNATQYEAISATIFNNLINALNEINDGADWTNYSTVTIGNIIKSIVQLYTAYDLFHDKPYTQNYDFVENNSGCKSGCIGLCTGCTGTCQASCDTSCTQTCADDCNNNCKTGCTGTCKNGCGDGCTSCTGGCSTGCTGGCKGSCWGNCYQLCTGANRDD